MIDFSVLFTDQNDPGIARFLAMTLSLYEQCEANKITLDELVGEETYSFRIPNSMAVFFNEFMELSVEMKTRININQLKELASNEPDQNNFWNSLIGYWENVHERRSSLQFLLAGNAEFQNEIISTVFDRYIQRQDQPQNIGDLKYDQITEVINMLNFAKKHIVVYSRSKADFLATMKRNYTLEAVITEYIWDLITKYRQDIIQMEILERIESISDTQDSLINIINKLIKMVEKLANAPDKCTETDSEDI